MIFNLFILYLIIVAVISFTGHKMNRLYYFNCIFIICLVGMRGYDIGSVDTINYVNYFLERQKSYHVDGSEVELGITLFNRLLRVFCVSGWQYLTIVAIITLLPLFYLIKKYSFNIHLSILFLFIVLGNIISVYFVCMRQVLGMAFFIWAIVIWLNKSKNYIIWYVLLLAIGCFFHSVIILPGIIFLLLYYCPISRKVYVSIAIISFLLGIMRIFDNLLIFSFLFYSGGPLERLAPYALIELSDGSGGYLYTTFRTILCIMLCLTLSKYDFSHVFSKMFLVGVVLFNILPNFSEIYRLGALFVVFGVIPISKMAAMLFNKIDRKIYINSALLPLRILFVAIICYSYYNYYATNMRLENKIETSSATLIPYSFFWEDRYSF
ncbi:EpsG family protein [uncultured Phocaeicola sp.]|uniref:EpsG family protein n=1 Tax=uncultured Phocaeicola sp. TaxID=990718 RepID=UPI00345B1980